MSLPKRKDINLLYSERDKIALGKCISPSTVDHCPICIDRCEAHQNKKEFDELIREFKKQNK